MPSGSVPAFCGIDDIALAHEALTRLTHGARTLVFFGTGGSSLGGQTLAQLRDYAVPGVGRFTESPRVLFLLRRR